MADTLPNAETLRGFTTLWAKTDRNDPSPDHYHPLALHLVDVAAVFHELLRSAWSPYRRRRWAEALGVDEELAGRWLAFIAGAHDLGKSSLIFEQQAPDQLARISAATGHDFRRVDSPLRLPHGLITAGTLRELLTERFGLTKPVAKRLALVTGAHHGRFATAGQLGDVGPRGGRSNLIGTGDWATWRSDLLEYLAQAVGLPHPLPEPIRTRPLTYAQAAELAGTISYADWIGSDERAFPFRTSVPNEPAVAFDDATVKAHEALRQLAFDAPTLPIPARTISDAFEHVQRPNAGQVAAMATIEETDGPGIAVIEYPMGLGKTEIALWMAARWAERDDIDGFYVAMPTRTTSDQLFARVERFLSHHARVAGIPPQLVRVSGQTPLAVGLADLDRLATDLQMEMSVAAHADASPDGIPPSEGMTIGADRRSDRRQSSDEAFRRAQWFGRRGRGLLARYGVGTVDQSMLGVLATNHYFVRLAGLASRTVIFDEVHSYDVYMSEIVDRLLGFLGALGSPVVILTATLPRHRTRELVTAYAGGANWQLPDWTDAAYPRLTLATAASGATAVSVTIPQEEQRPPLRLERIPSPTDDEPAMWSEVASRLAAALADGGTAAVVCNTVAQAQDAYRVLADVFPPDQLELFHARFRQRDRREIQDRVLRDFGKDIGTEAIPVRPRRRIVVATQVIEQSLDLDFDLMVSMFCPVDLLLQRSGRLHRHRTTDGRRPPSLTTPTLWLIGYEDGEDVPSFASGSVAVYGLFPLLRSWWALRGLDAIAIPEDIETLVEAAYEPDDDAPGDAPGTLAAAWEAARTTFIDRRTGDEREAEREMIPSLDEDWPAVGNDALTAERSFGEPVDELPPDKAGFASRTRLGPASVTVVVLTPAEARDLAPAITPTGDRQPPARLVAELLERSVNVSLRGVTPELIGLGPVPGWQDVPALRYARLVRLGEDVTVPLGDRWTVRLDERLGVCFDRVTATPPTIDEEEE